MKAWQTPIVGILMVVVAIGALVGLGVLGTPGTVLMQTGPGTSNQAVVDALDEALNVHDYSEVTVTFDIKSSLTNGQDDEDDWDIDSFVYTAEGNADLAKDYEVDCSGVSVLKIPTGATTTELTKAQTKQGGSNYLCKVNYYKFGRDWTIGDTELEMDDDVEVREADIGDTAADDSPGGGTTTTMAAGATYLITVVDDSEDDHIPIAFLFEAPTKGVIEADQFGSQQFKITAYLWKDAVAASKVRFDGEADDDQDNEDYSIDDLTVLSHDLTTAATNVDISGYWEFELTDEVALILDNTFRDSNTEQGYIQVTPYIQDTGAVHVPGADGSDFGTDDDDFIFTLEVQGVEIVSDSSTDAWTDYAGDKIRPSDGPASGLFKNLYGDGATATMKFKVENIPTADYDAADDANDDTLTGGEILFNITFYQVYTATEIMNSLKSSNQIMS